MRASVCKSIANTLNALTFSGNVYKFKRLNTLVWDPETTDDLTCYVVPDRQKWMVLDRATASSTWRKFPVVLLIFVKRLENNTQEEVDEYDNLIESMLTTISSTMFLDNIGSPTYTYYVRELDELEPPEEWQLTHQEAAEEQLYAGNYVRLIALQLEEATGDYTT